MERNTKFVDLHKVASLLRDIQTSGQAELESEIAHEEAVVEDNAFNTAAAKAAVAGHSEFEFNGKKYPVKMSKEEAQKLLDSQVNDEQPVVEEPKAEEDDAEEILKKGMEDEMADQIKDKLEDDEVKEAEPMGEYTDKEFACINIDTGEYGYCDKDELHKYTHYVPAKEFTYFDDTSGMDFADFDDEMADQEGWTKIGAPAEAVEEADVELTNDALKTILSLAGVKAVTDADINQPEAVEEYSNSPDEEYADADTQLNKLSGGVNGPKAIPAVGNDGHNRLVMKLKKAYSDME